MLQAAERAIEEEKERIMLQLKMSEQEAIDRAERNKFLKAGLAVAGGAATAAIQACQLP